MKIKDTLEALCIVEWQHVAVRRKSKNSVQYLGGGSFSNVVKRFGDENIIKSQITDGVLVLYVD